MPPGLARLATRPLPTGSAAMANTIGMTDVACFAATPATPSVTITSTLSRTNSVAISAKCRLCPSAQRYSIATLRRSIQPRPCRRRTAAVHWLAPEAWSCPGTLWLAVSRLLSARRDRPRRHAAVKRDELAPIHSMTSSAMASSVGGTVRPSILAVWCVDDQLELARLHDGQVCRLRALEDATVRHRPDATHPSSWAITHQPTGLGKFTSPICRGNRVAGAR